MSDDKLQNFYHSLEEYVEKDDDISDVSKAIVLVRVAIETGAREMGLPGICYLMSKLLTTTLGIIAGDETADYRTVLEEFDPETNH